MSVCSWFFFSIISYLFTEKMIVKTVIKMKFRNHLVVVLIYVNVVYTEEQLRLYEVLQKEPAADKPLLSHCRDSASALLVFSETRHFLQGVMRRQLWVVVGWCLMPWVISLCQRSVWCQFRIISFFRSNICKYQQADGSMLGSCAFEIPAEFQPLANLNQ